MLERLLHLKPFCEQLAESDEKLLLSEETWGKISELVQSLEPSKKAMVKLQNEDLLLTFTNILIFVTQLQQI